ncbi:MAG: hypothetical protein FJW29_07300 [Acidobacteria bacterium]|nr:hypothetical protein [Acidobacteriota bacterium]
MPKKAASKVSPAPAAGSKKVTPTRPAPVARTSTAAGKTRQAATPKTTRASLPSTLAAPAASTGTSTGRAELKQKLTQHTSTSPALTGGDVDADWGRADSAGDEVPGGDNPTPDQDVVDEIGQALGVEYEDDEDLRGGDEIADRDRHRWELNPEPSEDFDDR